MRLRTIILFFFLCCSGKIFSQQHIDSIITLASLKENITALAHDSMKGRLTASAELNNAAWYIQDQFKKAGLKPVAGNYEYMWGYYFNSTVGVPGVTANIVGAIQGDTGKVVIFCAHYDHIGTTKNGILAGSNIDDFKDTIFNGANDNASGVAALIELAKYYAAYKANDYSVIFIAFSGEEVGLVGSRIFADEIVPRQVVRVINMDMIGRSTPAANKKPYLSGNYYTSTINSMNSNLYAADSSYGKRYFGGNPFPRANLDQRGDHFSFSKKGIESLGISTSSPDDRYYHSPKDETGTIDFEFLHRVVKAIALACAPLLRN